MSYTRPAGALLLALLASALSPPATAQERGEVHALRAALDSTGYRGAVVVYDVNRDTYRTVYGERADLALIPASTFKILNSLVSLETGVIGGPGEVIAWDGERRERVELNRDLDLTTAFRLSAVPHFQALARRVGAERMQRYVDLVAYGNRDLSGGMDRFWLTGGLRISPMDQVRFLTRLYRNELPFSPGTVGAVKGMMVVEETPTHTIRAKTGWAIEGTRNIGWWVGWVERGAEVFVFATALEADSPSDRFGPARMEVTRAVLRSLGILAGAR